MKIKLLSFPVQPQHDSQKVPGIKALRGAFGLDLKTAKYLIEDLMDGKESFHTLVDREHLEAFGALGGLYKDTSASAVDDIKAILKTAVDNGDYELAADLLLTIRKHDV